MAKPVNALQSKLKNNSSKKPRVHAEWKQSKKTDRPAQQWNNATQMWEKATRLILSKHGNHLENTNGVPEE